MGWRYFQQLREMGWRLKTLRVDDIFTLRRKKKSKKKIFFSIHPSINIYELGQVKTWKNMKKQINVNPCICVTAKKFDVLDWALKTWSNSIVFTIWGFFLVIVVFITIRVFLLLFLIIGVVCLGCLGCLVYVWGGAWHFKCPRDLFTNRGSVGLTSADRRTSLLSRLQYPVP